MGNDTSKVSKPDTSKLTLQVNHSTSNMSPRSGLTLTSNNSTSIHKPALINNYSNSYGTATTPLSPLSPFGSLTSNANASPLPSSLTLDNADSLSYSQKFAFITDTIDMNHLPKKMMNDNKIITKNQGRKSKSSISKQRKKTIKKHRKNTNSSNPKLQNKSSINNGITNKYISEKIAQCASFFWINNIDVLQRKQQLEIGCIQFFYLLKEYPQVNKFFQKDKIEETALRFFDMFGWLIRSLNLDGVNLWRILAKIGEQHTKMGIKIHHYQYLLNAFHYSMSETFTLKYTIQIKYCIDQIYTIATCIMNGRQYEQLNTFGNTFGDRILNLNQCEFLESLTICLSYEIGREYLFRFLAQKYCSEIVIFLQLYQEYKEIFSQHHIEKVIKAKEIAKISLATNSEWPINVSYAAVSEFWSRLRICEMKYESNMDDFEIDPLLFQTVVNEIMQLILSNHWMNFTHTIKQMQQKNCVSNY